LPENAKAFFQSVCAPLHYSLGKPKRSRRKGVRRHSLEELKQRGPAH